MTAVIPVMDLNQREKLYFTPGLWRIKREIVAIDADLG